MLKVFKYQITPDDYFSLMLPKGAQILHIQNQFGDHCLWALVDPEVETELRLFRWAGTGHEIVEAEEDLKHVCSWIEEGGFLVWHVFEIINR